MTRSLRALLIFVVVCGCVGCDQATKQIARAYLPAETCISMLHDVVRLERTQNEGAFLSLGESLPQNIGRPLFTFGGLLIVQLGALWALFGRENSPLHILGVALACAGGLGNVIDRLIRGYVTDFLNVGIGPVRTGIFNSADMALMLGLALLLISSFRHERSERKQAPSR